MLIPLIQEHPVRTMIDHCTFASGKLVPTFVLVALGRLVAAVLSNPKLLKTPDKKQLASSMGQTKFP